MRITQSDTFVPATAMAGQLSVSAGNTSELIFVYPVFIDSTLQKNWERLLRQFIVTQFTNQIKTSNLLNIARSVTKPEVNSSPQATSPGETLTNILNSGDLNDPGLFNYHLNMQFSDQNNNPPARDSHHPKDYEDFIARNLEYIKSQIENDPKYANFNPSFSLVTIENNLTMFPLILGTHTTKAKSQPLFWLLFLALASNSRLDNSSNINDILKLIEYIPKRKYLEILDDVNIIRLPPELDNDNTSDIEKKYAVLKADLDNDVKKVARDFSNIAGSLNNFEAEIGIRTNLEGSDAGGITIANVLGQNLSEKAEFKSKSISTFNQSLVQSVFPLMQTINNMLISPNMEINFEEKYVNLLTEINRRSDVTLESILASINAAFGGRDHGLEFANNFENVCMRMHSLNPRSELSKIANLNVTYSDIQDYISNGGDAVIKRIEDFNETTTSVVAGLSAKNSVIVQQMEHFMRTDEVNMIDFNRLYIDYKASIQQLITRFYYGGDGQVRILTPDAGNTRFSDIFTGSTQNHLDTFVQSSVHNLASLITFLFLYSSIGYLCDFIRVVKKDVELKKNDVIAFPNYTMVVPYEYIRMLYFALAARNMKDLQKNLDQNRFKNFNFNESKDFKIVNDIVNRLQVPNIIIINSKTDEIYYKWCYSAKLNKINKSTIVNYIRSQQHIINAF